MLRHSDCDIVLAPVRADTTAREGGATGATDLTGAGMTGFAGAMATGAGVATLMVLISAAGALEIFCVTAFVPATVALLGVVFLGGAMLSVPQFI